MLRGLIVWLLIMGLETAHGVARWVYLVPAVGQKMSDVIGWPIGAGIVITIGWLLIPWTGLRQPHDLLRLGFMWAALTLIFETAIGIVRGLTAAQVVNDFNPFSGGLGLYTVIFILAAPLISARLRRP